MQNTLNSIRSKIQLQTSLALTLKTALPLLQRVKPAASAEVGQLLVCTPVVGAALSVWDAATCVQRVSEDVAQQRAMYATAQAKAKSAQTFREANAARRQLRDQANWSELSDADRAAWNAARTAQKSLASTHAVTLLEAEANAAKAAMPRARRLITALGAVRDVPLQLVRTVLGMISFAPSVGGSAALAATVPSPVSPVLNIASGLINIAQGLLEWHHARAGEASHKDVLRGAAGLRNGDLVDLNRVALRARHIKGSGKDIEGAAPHMASIYSKIHTHFEQAHQRSLQTAKLGKMRAAMQIAFGAVTTPLGVASLGLALAGTAAGTGGIALLVLPLVAAVVGIGWLVYLRRSGGASDRAAAAELELNTHQRAEMQQLLAETGGAIEAIEQRFLAACKHGAGPNKYVAAHLLAHHLSNPADPARRKTAARYLLASGMARDTVGALKRLPRDDDQLSLLTQTIEAYLLDGARPTPPSAGATKAAPAPQMTP